MATSVQLLQTETGTAIFHLFAASNLAASPLQQPVIIKKKTFISTLWSERNSQ
jgi:hypothetical protein